jgi:hypothetical protein
MSLINCCCAPPTPCGCTFPLVLTLNDFDPGDPANSVDTSPPGQTGPWTLTWGASPSGSHHLNKFNGAPTYTVFSGNTWVSGPITGLHGSSAPIQYYLLAGLDSCQLVVEVVFDTGPGLFPDLRWYYDPAVSPVYFSLSACTPFRMDYLTGPAGGVNTSSYVTATHAGTDMTGPSLGLTPFP